MNYHTMLMNTVHSINHFLPIDSRDKKNTQYKNDILSSEWKFALVNFKAVLRTDYSCQQKC